MKKILIIGQLPKEHGGSYTTGVANVIVNLLPFISENKFEKHLWASNINKIKNEDIYNTKTYGISRIRIFYLIIKYLIKFPRRVVFYEKYLNYGIKPLRNLVYEMCISELINEIKPDLIHVHNIGFLPSVFYANNKKINNILLTYHGIFYNDKSSIEQCYDKGIDLKKLFYNSSQLISNFTVLTEDMKKDAVKLFDIFPDKISVIANGVGEGFMFEKNEGIGIRKKLKIQEEEKVFISVGALTKRKNHIGAIKFLQNNFSHFKYIIIGREGDYKDFVMKEVVKDDNVILISYVKNNELYKYYSASDYFLLPSTQEGQALVCLEAFSCGLPVLINKDIIGTLGVSERFKKYFRMVDLSDNNYELFDKLSIEEKENLVSLSKEHLNWNNVASKYMKKYDQIIN